uniref:Uncharacterized protein n=1 Tax=Anguilla anguilla TaxID=7936 RepID=A0A0E9SVY7_ANGAN
MLTLLPINDFKHLSTGTPEHPADIVTLQYLSFEIPGLPIQFNTTLLN